MYTTIVDPKTLHDHLGDPNWIVIDCRHNLLDYGEGRRLYDEGHIPGAQFVYVETDLSAEKTGTNGRHPLPHRETFVEFLRSLGVNENTQIVAYDAGVDMFASRLWFMTRWIGHGAIALLDGGYASWVEARYPITTEPSPQHPHGNLQLHAQLDRTFNANDVLAEITNNGNTADGSYPHAVLLDARGAERFAGQNETMDPVAGHIPGAQNRFFKENFDDRGRWKSPEQLRKEFAEYGDPANVVHYCGSGVSSAVNLIGMHIADLTGAALYPGSWSEWCADRSRPMVTP